MAGAQSAILWIISTPLAENPEECTQWVVDHVSRVKHVIRMIIRDPAQWEDELPSHLTAPAGSPSYQPLPPPTSSLQCTDCGRSFSRPRALATHRLRVHGQLSRASAHAHGVACVACLKQFHTRGRRVQHLNVSSSWCLDATVQNVGPADDHIRDVSRAEQRADRASAKSKPLAFSSLSLPSFRLPGPLPAWAVEAKQTSQS